MVLSGRKRSRLSWGGHVALACALCPPPIPSATPHQQARGSADPAPLDGASLGGCSPRAVCVSPHGTNRPAALDPPENLLGPHLRPPATHWPTPQAQAHGSTDAPPRDRASVGDDAATSNSARSGKLIPRGSDVVVGRASLGSPDDFQRPQGSRDDVESQHGDASSDLDDVSEATPSDAHPSASAAGPQTGEPMSARAQQLADLRSADVSVTSTTRRGRPHFRFSESGRFHSRRGRHKLKRTRGVQYVLCVIWDSRRA